MPLWGYADESDPAVMAKKIDAAADNGIDAFIFDWYYYNDGPFLEAALDQGYLKSPNRSRLKFALMWANHDWLDLHPYTKGSPHQLLYPGKVTPEKFDEICDKIIKDYFLQPTYWKINGKPYFSFYEMSKLMDNFGSIPATRAALDRFRAKAVAAGLPGIHLNAVAWGHPILPGENKPVDMAKVIRELGFDSVTSYVWVHHASLPKLQTDYNTVRDAYNKYWAKAATAYGVPYFPNVSMGWDPSPPRSPGRFLHQRRLSLHQHHHQQHPRQLQRSTNPRPRSTRTPTPNFHPARAHHQFMERMDRRQLYRTRYSTRNAVSGSHSRCFWPA